MARRRPWSEPNRRTTLTWTVLDQARRKVTALQDNVIDATCQFPRATKREVVSWLFDEDKLALIQAATPYLSSRDDYESFTLPPVGASHTPITVTVKGWREWGMNAPNDECLQIHEEAAALFQYVDGVRRVLDDYALVRHVLNWMDEHATPGAIKYYWPTVLSLCDAEVVRNATERFQEPAGVSTMLDLCRTTANTVAMGIMAPTKKVEPTSGVTLTIPEHEITTMPIHKIKVGMYQHELCFTR